MNALLSIKPEYVEEIEKGNKKYEFRKAIFKEREVHKVWIYESSPTKKIVGVFTVGKIIKDKPRKLWENFKDYSGIGKDAFFAYFLGKDIGFAIEIKKTVFFKVPIDPKRILPCFTPPQSFCYFEEHVIKELETRYDVKQYDSEEISWFMSFVPQKIRGLMQF